MNRNHNSSLRNGGQWIFLVLVLLATGCDRSGVLTDRFVPVPDRAWDYAYQPAIQVHIKDQNGPYRIYLNLRHTDQYRYSNIYVLLHQRAEKTGGEQTEQTGGEKAEIQTRRFELKLAESDGRWTGRHSGNLYTHRQLVLDSYFFPDTGIYTLSLEQNMRENPLKHIVEAGVRVERAE